MEQWRDIPFEGWYECEVSNEGRVRNKTTGKIYKPYNMKGYQRISKTYNNGRSEKYKRYRRFAHVLVAAAFPEICGEWFDGCVIDHIDGDKSNNNAENLRVCTHFENMQNPVTKKRIKGNAKYSHSLIRQMDLEGNEIKIWRSDVLMKEIGNKHIFACCNGYRKKASGYKWEYVKLEDLPGEIWRDVPNTKGHKISNMGRVKFREREIFGSNNGFYTRVSISKSVKYVCLHQLVAQAFPEICGEWFEGAEVDHLNSNTFDNRAENLRVCTHAENMLNENTKRKYRKPVLLLNGFKVIAFPSAESAENYLYGSHGSVRHAIRYGFRTGKKRTKKNRDKRGLDTSYRAYWLEDLV